LHAPISSLALSLSLSFLPLLHGFQDHKTDIYKTLVAEAAEARPGVLALMDEAIRTPGVAVGICSAATRAGFDKVGRFTEKTIASAKITRSRSNAYLTHTL